MTSRALSCLLGCFLTAATALAADPPSPQRSLPGKAPAAANAEHDPQPEPRAAVPPKAVQDLENALRQNADMLDVLYKAMHDYNPGGDGPMYWLSGDNAMDADWIQQTPNVWGMSADKVQPGAGLGVADKVKNLVGSAQTFVDITSLSPFPTGAFQQAIIEGLKQVAHSGKPVKVRILVGWYPGIDGRLDQRAYLREIMKPLHGIAGSNLKIYAGAIQVGITPPEWNHSKMVAVDGQRALLGGENLWDADYLQVRPAHDLNLTLRGPFVFGMDNFADSLWGTVCSYVRPDWKPAYWQSGWNDIGSGCLAKNGLSRPPAAGSLRVLGAGRLGRLAPDGNPADVAMALALRSSASTIRLSQQDLGATDPATGLIPFWWDEGMTALAQALVKKQNVYIVLSNDHAKAGPQGDGYWNKIPLTETADKIKEYVQKQPGAPTGDALRKLLCSNLHLAPLRFGPSDRWPNGWTFANHAKFFMIDDRLFYVGSENFYPVSLQEYGVFLNDANAASQLKAQYWDKLWDASSKAAISGSETSNCHFK